MIEKISHLDSKDVRETHNLDLDPCDGPLVSGRIFYK